MDELGRQPGLRAVLLQRQRPAFSGRRRPQMGQGRRRQARWRKTRVPAGPPRTRSIASIGLPIPTVALVQGGCFGGGTGIVAACDIVIAADNAIFSIAEVRWGLTAAIIIPQLSDAISRAPAAPLCPDRRALRCGGGACASGSCTKSCPRHELDGGGRGDGRRPDGATDPHAMAETKAFALQERLGWLWRRDPRWPGAGHALKRRSAEAAKAWPLSSKSARPAGSRPE